MDNIPDNLLVNQSREGNQVALDMLMRRYKPLVKSKAKVYFLIGGDLEDLIQEGMIGLYKAVLDFNPIKGIVFASFASLCVVRQIQTAIKAASRQKHMPLNSSISIYSVCSPNNATGKNNSKETILEKISDRRASDPEALFIGRETYKDIDYFIHHQLSPLEFDVLMLYMAGKSCADIACDLEKNSKSITNTLQRVRKKVSEYVKTLNRGVSPHPPTRGTSPP